VLDFKINIFFSKFLKSYKNGFLLLFLFIIASNSLELFGIYMILPVVHVMSGSSSSDFLLLNFFNLDFLKNNILLIFFSIYLIKFITLFFIQWYQHSFIYKLQTNLATKLTEISFLKKVDEQNSHLSSEKLIQIVVNEVGIFCNQFVMPITILFSEIVFILFLLSFMMILYTKSTLIILAFVSVIIAGYYWLIIKKIIKKAGKQRAFFDSSRIKVLNEIILSFKEIVVYSKQDIFLNDFKKNDLKYTATLKIIGALSQLPRLFIEFFIIGIVIFFLFINSNSFSISNFLPEIALGAGIFIRLMPSFTRIVSGVQQIHFAQESLKNINNYFNNIKHTNECNSYEVIIDHPRLIEFENINFNYRPDKPIFNEMNLKIFENTIVGITGPSGSGKSTLVNMILGFVNPSTGSVCVNGNNIFEKKTDYLNHVSFISQNSILLNDTILNNITFNENRDEVDFDLLRDSIKKSELEEFVNSQSKKIDTIVGEKGALVSSGQIQRIALARALYAKRNIIILDEATNSIDSETENKIFKTLVSLKNKRIIILISHNTENFKYCDFVFELKNQKFICI
jgi:ABC-type multidrug transport system fused ATPase/permease subunit